MNTQKSRVQRAAALARPVACQTCPIITVSRMTREERRERIAFLLAKMGESK